MSGRYLLDTNIIIDLLANEAGIKAKLSGDEEVFVSSITIGGLFYGAEKSTWPAENVRRIAAIARQRDLILVTRDKHFNEIEGLPIAYW
jgi:predicted nucleic acid-binding protein